jgi:diguanylate cyclase (GGDEF)-like protein
MPGIEGNELCRKVRQLSRQHYTYTILLTSKNQKRELIEGLNAGADDYIVKPFDADEMRARLLVAERIVRVQEELVAARDAMKTQATHDYLTKLLNRAGIMDVLRKELDRTARTGEPFSVIIADLDHFKQINDTYGHLSGDDVLAETARRIRASLRSYDSVGRYGGEEFLIIVPGCNEATAFDVAEKIRATVCQMPMRIMAQDRTITASLGVSTTYGAISAEELLSAADSALYRAKNSGRNRSASATVSFANYSGEQLAAAPVKYPTL